jgi:hypothetical protein
MRLQELFFEKMKEKIEEKIKENTIISGNHVMELLEIPQEERDRKKRIEIGRFMSFIGWESHRLSGTNVTIYLNINKLRALPIEEAQKIMKGIK